MVVGGGCSGGGYYYYYYYSGGGYLRLVRVLPLLLRLLLLPTPLTPNGPV